MFTREERSTFSYWFAHWCAYQMTALNLRIWKPKYLLHDIEKPWLKLFLPYDKVQNFHNNHASHHLIHYLQTGKLDIDAWIIDTECGRYTKNASLYQGVVEKLYSSFNEYELYLETCIKQNDSNKTINWIESSNVDFVVIAEKLQYIYFEINKRLEELGFVVSPNKEYMKDTLLQLRKSRYCLNLSYLTRETFLCETT